MSQEAEQEVIAALLWDNSAFQAIDLDPEEFGVWHFQEIYSAMAALIADGQIADVVTVASALEQRVPDTAFLPLLRDVLEHSVGSVNSIGTYAEIIRKNHRLRRALEIAAELMTELKEHKNLDAADSAIQQLMGLNRQSRKYEWSMDEILRDAVKQVEAAHEADGLVGINTGLEDLNNATGGWHDSDLVIVPARPAMGKTALMLNFAYHANCPVGIISAEQDHDQIGLRFISIHGKIDSQKIRTAQFNEGEWTNFSAAVTSLRAWNIRVYDEGGVNITRLVRQAREWKYRYGMRLLCVDYVQKIKGSKAGMSRLEQVTEVVGCLKNLAKELHIPVIALAQVNRNVDSRENKRPSMGDISDCSEVEKEADLIATLYRDEAYHEDSPDKGIAEIDICKNRHGPTGVIRTVWRGQFMRFEEIAPQRYADSFGGAA